MMLTGEAWIKWFSAEADKVARRWDVWIAAAQERFLKEIKKAEGKPFDEAYEICSAAVWQYDRDKQGVGFDQKGGGSK